MTSLMNTVNDYPEQTIERLQLAVAAGQDELKKLAIEADKPFEQEDAYQQTMAWVIELQQQIEAMIEQKESKAETDLEIS